MRVGDLWGWGNPRYFSHRACVEDPSFVHEDLENDEARQYAKTVDHTRQELTHRIKVVLSHTCVLFPTFVPVRTHGKAASMGLGWLH